VSFNAEFALQLMVICLELFDLACVAIVRHPQWFG
jgi:hypothetical protein